MKRKVIQLAGRTLVVSLPSKWAKKYRVIKGDSINVNENGHKLEISPENELMSKKTSISIVGLDPLIKRALGAIYKAGYDEVDVEFEPRELEKAQQVIRDEFVGFEVVYKSKKHLTVKKVSSINNEEFDTILRRVFLIVLQMAEEGRNAVENNDTEWMRSIAYMDKDVNRYTDFCRRVINKHGYSKFRLSPPMYYIVEQLERIGDSYRDICTHAISKGIKPSSKTLEMFDTVNEVFKEFYELFYKFDLKKLRMVTEKRYKMLNKFDKILEECNTKEFGLLLLLYTVLDNTFDMNGALLAMNL
jgi:phosphate uptake regulator